MAATVSEVLYSCVNRLSTLCLCGNCGIILTCNRKGLVILNNSEAKDSVILIPSLEPDKRLPAYISDLARGGFSHIVVVDDGSGEEYQSVFREIEQVKGAVVLHHEVNKGKGAALKTGYSYILNNIHGINGVITADADGQHTVSDCLLLAEKLGRGERALYLGSRDFSLEHVPPKSRIGNRVTSALFFVLYGKWLDDTQTGLRAFRGEDLRFMIDISGDRFEYEMNVLVACARNRIPMIPVSIETVYENENEGSHYNPLKDSIRIFRVLLSGFFKFMGSSLICVLIDQVLFNIFNLAVFANGKNNIRLYVIISTVIARLVSATFNYLINKNLVFRDKGRTGSTLFRYIIVSVCIMLLSGGGTWLLAHLTGMSTFIAKLIVDTFLYFASYRFQRSWVFREGN